MKQMNLKKHALAVAAGLALGAAVTGAQAADSLVFPYITSATGTYTFISLVNDGSAGTERIYHMAYRTKVSGSANTSACQHFDGSGATTPADLMQFEVANRVSFAAFGDTTSTPVTMVASATTREGFLLVEAYDSANVAAGTNMFGEATLISAASGLAYTYNALSSASDFGAAMVVPDTTADRLFQWYPTAAATSRLYVLPTDTAASMRNVDLLTTIASSTVNAFGDGSAMDNNEKAWSGVNPTAVRCFGSVALSDLIQPDTLEKVKNGGFMAVTYGTSTADTSAGWLASKLQTSTALGGVVTTVNSLPNATSGNND